MVWREMKGAGVEAGEGNGGVGGMGDMLSAIGSSVSAKEEAEALCGIGTGPSVIDGFRACGWFGGTGVEDVRAKGDDARGELFPAKH